MKRKEYLKQERLKKVIYAFSITLIISIVAFLTIFVMYNKKLKKEANEELSKLKKMNAIVDNNDLTEVSYSKDLTIENKNNNTKNEVVSKNNTNTESSKKNSAKKDNKSNVTSNNTKIENKTKNSKEPIEAKVEKKNTVKNNTVENKVEENAIKKVLKFESPVSGEIIKDFAKDTLLYSKTLEEWTTHLGIDIKADKTTVVAASEEGTVESIKNDPRYGLTVIIAHDDGFKTFYSNLMTAEFVKEGDKVEKGQTIGTIGESSSFEIADEPHLHFEMYKNGETVNPTIYLK